MANLTENPPPCDTALALWNQVSATLQLEVSVDTFRRWFQDIRPVSLDEKQLTLCVPNSIHQLWIESNYQSLLHSALMLATGKGREIVFVFDTSPAAVAPEGEDHFPEANAGAESHKPNASSGNGLNPRNTF